MTRLYPPLADTRPFQNICCPVFGSSEADSILEQLPIVNFVVFPAASETVNPSFKIPLTVPFPVTVFPAAPKHEKSVSTDPAEPAPAANGYPNLAVHALENGLTTLRETSDVILMLPPAIGAAPPTDCPYAF